MTFSTATVTIISLSITIKNATLRIKPTMFLVSVIHTESYHEAHNSEL
jgi:hypothetical protein